MLYHCGSDERTRSFFKYLFTSLHSVTFGENDCATECKIGLSIPAGPASAGDLIWVFFFVCKITFGEVCHNRLGNDFMCIPIAGGVRWSLIWAPPLRPLQVLPAPPTWSQSLLPKIFFCKGSGSVSNIASYYRWLRIRIFASGQDIF